MLIHLSIGICGTIIFKKLANEYFKKKGIANALFFQYFVAVIAAIAYKMTLGEGLVPLNVFLMVASVGAINALGAYYQWYSYAFSLSRTILLAPLMNIITISLAVLFLNEAAVWNYYLAFGVILAILGPILYQAENKDKIRQRLWMFSTAALIIIFSITQFAMRAFASFVQMPLKTGKVPFGIPVSDFLLSFYIGAFLSSVLILGLKKGNNVETTKRSMILLFLLGLGIISTTGTLYWALSIAEASKITPVQSAGLILGSILIGWLGFGEVKELTKIKANKKMTARRIIALIASIIGVALILTSK